MKQDLSGAHILLILISGVSVTQLGNTRIATPLYLHCTLSSM